MLKMYTWLTILILILYTSISFLCSHPFSIFNLLFRTPYLFSRNFSVASAHNWNKLLISNLSTCNLSNNQLQHGWSFTFLLIIESEDELLRLKMYTYIPKVDSKYLRQINQKLSLLLEVTPYTNKLTARIYFHFRFELQEKQNRFII